MPNAAGLYYFVHGENETEKPPIILLHGAGGTHLHWPANIRRLAGQRILAPDLPGHGKSEGLGRQEILDYAQVIVEFMKALKLRAAILVGISMGSAIAMQIAIRYPTRVLGLALLGSGAKLRVASSLLDNSSNPSAFQSTVQMITESSFSVFYDERLKTLAAQRLSETRPSVLHGDFLACNDFDAMEKLGRIKAPTLIICGAEDRMTPPKYSEFLGEQIPNAQIKIVPEAGHMVMLEKAKEVAVLLEEFLLSFQPK